jgi:ABC-type Fe3+ transport system permease subunit
MAVKSLKHRPISPGTREKCIKRAQKEVESLDKWGYWLGVFFVVVGVLMCGMSIAFVVLMQRFAEMCGNPQQAQNAVWQGLLLGLIFGFITAALAFKGAFYIHKGIWFFRGNPEGRMLVEYHDTLVNLMHEQDGELSCESDAVQSQESLSAVKSNR